VPVAELADDARAVLRARLLLRRADHVGAHVRCWGRPVITNRGRLIIHDRVRLNSTVTRTELVTGPDGLLEVGERTYINYGSSIAASQSVTIGAHCLLGIYTVIIDNDFHRVEPDRRLEVPDSAPVVLEENVWLGARAIVLPGVTIGTGSVIAAGSVVTRDIPAGHLAGGIPARIIRTV
jgi:acetyltransferase-like isoleucine patch superfamily enzyme